jgi:hypothetical protein
MSQIDSRRIDELMMTLQQLRQRHLMSESSFYKSMVCLAYESSVDNDIPSTMALLSLCPTGYFRSETHREQLKDPLYREVAEWLSTKLVSSGFLELGSMILPRAA